MTNRHLLILFLFTASIFLFGQDYYLGGQVSVNTPLEVNTDDFSNSILQYSLAAEPFIAGGYDIFEYYISLKFGIENEPAIKIFDMEAYMILYLGDYVSLKAGRFIHTSSAALLLARSNFLTPLEWTALFNGNFNNITKPSNLVQGTLYFQDLYLRLSWEPYPGLTQLPSSDSIWFPQSSIPQKIIAPPVTPDEGAVLRNIIVSEEPLDFSFENNGIMAEFGGLLGPVDFNISYFHGLDRLYTYNALFETEGQMQFSYYDAVIIGNIAPIDAFGLNAAYSVLDFTFWSELTLTLNKPYTVSGYILDASQIESYDSLHFTANAGAMYQFYSEWVSGFLSIEYSHGWFFEEAAKEYFPPLSNLFGGVLETLWFDGKMGIHASVLLDSRKWSIAHVYTLTYNPMENISIGLTAPFFHGTFRSDFGQFTDNHLISLNFNWTF